MPTEQQMQDLRAVVPYAQQTQRRWHVPASVTLAQWIFESGWGQDDIAVQARNCFGIKHLQRNYQEPYVAFRTPEYVGGVKQYQMADFVKYDSVAASFEDHGRLLGTLARYTPALSYLPDVSAYARHLQMGGYSTTPTYAVDLCREIALLHLTQYDVYPVDVQPARNTA